MTRLKRLFFYAVLSTPLIVLYLILGSLGYRFYEISLISSDDVEIPRTPDRFIQTPQSKQHFSEVLNSVKTSHPGAESNDEEHFLIGLFGASSLVVPERGRAFPQKLEDSLRDFKIEGRSIRVLNFGYPGMVSATVGGMAVDALDRFPLDLMVFYAGHNDYTAIFSLILESHFHPFPPWADTLNRWLMGERIKSDANWRHHMKNVRNPALAKWLLEFGVIQLDESLKLRADMEINARILKVFESIVERAAQKKVPVVLVPPVSNLNIEPISVNGKGEEAYAKALETVDPEERIGWLKQARDEDLFNGMIRAKSSLGDTFREFSGDQLCHVDLEARLIKAGFLFDSSVFSDEVHFTEEGHERIAEALDGALREISFCRSTPEQPSP